MLGEKVGPVTAQAQVGGPGRAAAQEGGKESDLKIRFAASKVAVFQGERGGMASAIQFCTGAAFDSCGRGGG